MMRFLYDLCHMLPLNLVAALSFLTYLGRQEDSLGGCIAGILVILFVLALGHTGKKERILICGVVTFAVAGLCWVLGEEKRAYLLERLDFLPMILGVAVGCMIVGKLAQDYFWLMLVVALALVGNLIYLMIGGIPMSRVAVAGSFLVIMIYLATGIQTHWEKSGYTDLKTHVSLIAPMLLITFILVCLSPAPEKPFDWSPVKNLWEWTVVGCKRLTGILVSREDEYQVTGFSENSSFGGSVDQKEKDVMLLTNYDKSLDSLYLGGITFGEYTVNGWEGDKEEESNYRQFDYLETRAAIRNYDLENESDYLKKAVFKAENRLLYTKHVFVPGKVDLESGIAEIPKYKETEEGILTTSGLRYGDTYSVSWYRLNVSNPDLAVLMDQAKPIAETQWQDTLKKAEVSEPETYSYDKYLRYRTTIYEKYGTTVGLSPEVTALVEQITEGIGGKYERLQAIAAYLQTMEYHTAPGPIPTQVTNASSYLDYFLLESGQGYCVHYATAFVLLARECGYPARYVQGYCVKMNPKTKEYLVTEGRAHAWAEVYFDHFGWVVFEATPGYSLSNGWNVGKTTNVAVQKPPVPRPQPSETVEDILPEELLREEKKVIRISYIVVPVLLAVLYGVIYLFISQLLTKHKYRKMSNDAKVRFLMQRNLKMLRRLGYPLLPTETIEEYGCRVEAESLGRLPALHSLGLYEKLLYSDYRPNAEDVEVVEQDYRLLGTLLLSRSAPFVFIDAGYCPKNLK